MAASSRPAVLVVDDSAEARELLAHWVRSLGYRVATAATGEAALETVRREMPDLILLDVLLPGLNGFEVCERLKAQESTRTIPIVLISGLRHPENIRRGRALGARHFLLKPFDESELTQVMHAALLERRGGSKSALRVPAGPVLIVEDDQHMLRFVAEALSHVGVRVVTAENGLEALEQLRRHRPCLIMLDLALPLLDGNGFVAAARNDPEVPLVPVVCLSGLPDAARRAEELGAVACLAKPIDPDTLLGVVLRHASEA